MTQISILYFRAKPGAKGSKRYFWDPSSELRREGRRCVRLSDDYDTALAEARARNDELARWRGETGGVDQPRSVPAAGTVRAMIAGYQSSRFWRERAPKTQQNYQWHLTKIDAWIGDKQAARITPLMVQELLQELYEAGKPALANARIRVLRLLFKYGRLAGYVTANPVDKPGLIMPERKVEPIIWTAEMVNAVVETADALGRHSIGTAVLLNEWFGQREGDILALTSDAYRDGCITVKQSKTGAVVPIPVDMVPHLVVRYREEAGRQQARLRVVAVDFKERGQASPRYVIINEETGRPYTSYCFQHVFRKACLAAEERHPQLPLAQLRFMWLRHTAVTRMAEAGCQLHEIASITGHELQSVVSIIEHGSRAHQQDGARRL